MAEDFPRYDFLAEPLRDQIGSSIRAFGKSRVVTYTRNLIKIACRVYPQNLDRDFATLMFAHPHIGVPTTVQCILQSVITKWDLK